MYALTTISYIIRKSKNQQYMGDHKYMETTKQRTSSTCASLNGSGHWTCPSAPCRISSNNKAVVNVSTRVNKFSRIWRQQIFSCPDVQLVVATSSGSWQQQNPCQLTAHVCSIICNSFQLPIQRMAQGCCLDAVRFLDIATAIHMATTPNASSTTPSRTFSSSKCTVSTKVKHPLSSTCCKLIVLFIKTPVKLQYAIYLTFFPMHIFFCFKVSHYKEAEATPLPNLLKQGVSLSYRVWQQNLDIVFNTPYLDRRS